MSSFRLIRKIGELFYSIIYCALLSLFSYIIPKEDSLLVLGSHGGVYVKDNPKYVHRYLTRCKKNLGFRVIYVTNDPQFVGRENFVKKGSFKAFFYLLRAKAIIISHGILDVSPCGFFGKFNIIQSWHGTPIKRIGFDSIILKLRSERNIIKSLTLIMGLIRQLISPKIIFLSPSEKVSVIFKSVFRPFLRGVWETGYPRNDIFFNKCLRDNKIIEKMGLKKFNEIILYAPTYRKKGEILKPFSEDTLEEIDRLLRERNWVLLVKKHPNTKKIEILETNNIIDVSNQLTDVQELLPYVDILITDFSSIIYDFMITNRPVILYTFGLSEYSEGFLYDLFRVFSGLVVKDEKELVKLLKSSGRKTIKRISALNSIFNKENDGLSTLKLLFRIVREV